MTNQDLARSYLSKIKVRLAALAVLRDGDAHSDVVREAQELVELALKGALRAVGVEPPKHHDVGGLLAEYAAKLPMLSADEITRAAAISKDLRKQRELAFYRDIDFIPTEEYTASESSAAYSDAQWIADLAARVIGGLRS